MKPTLAKHKHMVRQICPTVRTSTEGAASGMASAKLVTLSGHRATRQGIRGWSFRAATEKEALLLLQEQAPLTHEEKLAVIDAVSYLENPTAPKGTRELDRQAWLYEDLVTRGPRPKARRHSWKDPVTGKKVNIHADTLRMHRDPNCKCRWCSGRG